jgi:hypothetical protein
MKNFRLFSRTLLTLFLVAGGLASFAAAHAAEKCKWQENCDCKAPGPSMRWENAYCMAKLGITDAKEGIDQLNKCFRTTVPSGYDKMSGCTKNQFWRTKICELKGAGHQCMESEDQIPAFIEKGQ